MLQFNRLGPRIRKGQRNAIRPGAVWDKLTLKFAWPIRLRLQRQLAPIPSSCVIGRDMSALERLELCVEQSGGHGDGFTQCRMLVLHGERSATGTTKQLALGKKPNHLHPEAVVDF